jgi:DNA-binding CsgD family transcriptional regulator
MAGGQSNARMSDTALVDLLTDGEKLCLESVSQGRGSKDIARELGISPHTVDARLRSASAKLKTNSRFVAARILQDFYELKRLTSLPDSRVNLTYQISPLPSAAEFTDEMASAGKGNGPAELGHSKPISLRPQLVLDGDRSWLNRSHPIAKFFGGENSLGFVQRTMTILLIAFFSALAFGVVLNGLVGISRIAFRH